ncbi:transposase [Streptomyces sp. NPDC046727]|uniref:IS701 family transposase n=1 Tax=Streptomyces sp. NPDC046727 TaxID=3155373 RepID=UPI0033E60496
MLATRNGHSTIPDGAAVAAFVNTIYASLPRADQRRWAQAHLSALLTVPGRKTLRGLAQAVTPRAGSAHGLQQFINGSTWDWAPVRQALARAVTEQGPPQTWSIATITIRKRGHHSVGVHRRFDAGAGRVVNCQLAIGLFATTPAGSLPVDWRLLLDDTWSTDTARRSRARIPDTVTARTVAEHMRELVAAGAALSGRNTSPWVLDLTGTPDAALVIDALTEHGQDFLCEVGPAQPMHVTALGGRPVPAATAMTHRRGQAALASPVPRDGRGSGRYLLHIGRAYLAGGQQHAPLSHRLVMEPPSPLHRAGRYWVTNMADRIHEIPALAETVMVTDCAIADLIDDFGVQDFEGRSYPGWHHHMTMAAAAYVFSRLHHASPRTCRHGHHPTPRAAPLRLTS